MVGQQQTDMTEDALQEEQQTLEQQVVGYSHSKVRQYQFVTYRVSQRKQNQ